MAQGQFSAPTRFKEHATERSFANYRSACFCKLSKIAVGFPKRQVRSPQARKKKKRKTEMSVFFFVAFGRQATMGEEEVEEQAWEVLWTSLDQAAGHIQRGAMALCTYYEDAVGPGTCDDLARAFSSTRDALHYWARVWTAALCALVVFLYENPIVLAVVAGAVALYFATRLVFRLAQRLTSIYRRWLRWIRQKSRVAAAVLPPTAFFVLWGYALTFEATAHLLNWPFMHTLISRFWPFCLSVAAITQLEDVIPAQQVCTIERVVGGGSRDRDRGRGGGE